MRFSHPYSTKRSEANCEMSNFAFLQQVEWEGIRDAAIRAERLANFDPRASCFYARRSLEIAVSWMYKRDRALYLPYQDHLSALIHEPTFRTVTGDAVFSKAKLIKELGNLAVHSTRPVRPVDALTAVKELFQLCYWLARTYSTGPKPSPQLTFNPALLPQPKPAESRPPAKTPDQLKKLQEQLRESDEKLSALLADKATMDAELKRLREEVAAAKKANEAQADMHDYTEAETRDYFIDLLLKEAGWALDNPEDTEFEVSGMPNKEGKGFVDYVLWGDDGKPLAVVEAKRTKRDPKVGQQQARLYADCLEKQFGQRPLIFYSNGYEHWFWDDTRYPPREVQGFYKKAELELLVQRRITRKPLATEKINDEIIERYYQTRAIRRIAETFERDNQRKALIVMATGAGKTRTVIALADLLLRCNWAKRILFLADRTALVNQAVNAFKRHLPDSAPVNLVTEKDVEGRVYVSTYPTMMGLIDEARDGQRRFGIGHFDLVVIDEAHRSVYKKYRAIFDYLDSLLVGLTATPKDEIDRDTYAVFNLERGVPTDAYPLEDAVKDGFLVPPQGVSVAVKIPREGLRYDQLSDEERDQWDAIDWTEDGSTPTTVEAEAVNKWLFNSDTVDKVLEHVMTRGQRVAGGDRLGKTIIFAKNNDHAEFIAQRFNENYPQYKGEFARVITFKTEYAQSLIDNFSSKDKMPHIAISVDMLDTGIDVPEIVNLVFFKLVRSKTKFWQMVGRGTRLCPELFGPGQDKAFFYIFDYCQNLEFFSVNPPTTEGSTADSLGARLFKARLELIQTVDGRLQAGSGHDPPAPTQDRDDHPAARLSEQMVREETAETLRTQVAAMNTDNFLVRPKRRLVERFAAQEAWINLAEEDYAVLAMDVAALPTQKTDDDVEAKQFDLLMLRVQLALLRSEPRYERLRDQVREIVSSLEDKPTIPMVAEQMWLIDAMITEEWWQDVTLPMLEVSRKRLRLLIKFIEKTKRKVVYTNFEDQLGGEVVVELPHLSSGADYERFRAKARQFLRTHEDHVAMQRLKRNVALTSIDLLELERMLLESGVGSADDIARAKSDGRGLGYFVRSLVGLDRETAKEALGQFVAGTNATANQVEFINLMVDYLTEHGIMEPALLYESPFTDISPLGPEDVFSTEAIDELVAILQRIQANAAA